MIIVEFIDSAEDRDESLRTDRKRGDLRAAVADIDLNELKAEVILIRRN